MPRPRCKSTGKVRYDSRAKATHTLGNIIEHRTASDADSLDVYYHPECQAWHLGRSQPSPRGDTMTQRELSTGTIVHINGFPVRLDGDVWASSASWDLIEAPLPESTGVKQGEYEQAIARLERLELDHARRP